MISLSYSRIARRSPPLIRKGQAAGILWRRTRIWQPAEWLLFGYIVALFAISGDPTFTHIENLFGYSLLGMWLIGVLIRRDQLKVPKEYWLVFLLVLWGLMSLWYGPMVGLPYGTIDDQIVRLRTFVEVAGLGFVTVNVLHTSGSPRSVEWGFYVGVLVSLSFVLLTPEDVILQERVGAGIGQANELGVALGAASILAFAHIARVMQDNVSRKGSITFLVVFLLGVQLTALWLNVAFIGSRQGIVLTASVVIISIAYLLFQLGVHRNKDALVGLGTAILGLVMVRSAALDSFVVDRLRNVPRFLMGEGLLASEGSLPMRVDLAREGVALWMERPIVGWGFDAFRHISVTGTYTHVNAVELLATLGLIGFLIYYGMLGVSFFRIYRIWKSDKVRKTYSAVAFAVLGVILISGMAVVNYYSKVHWLLFGYMLWMVTFDRRTQLL